MKLLLDIDQKDVRMTTGSNLRFIMMLTRKNLIEHLETESSDFEYNTVEDDAKWKINLGKELIIVKYQDLTVAGLDDDELEKIIEYLCIN